MGLKGSPESGAVAMGRHGFKDSATKAGDGGPGLVQGVIVGNVFRFVGLPVGEPPVRGLPIEMQEIPATVTKLSVVLFGAPVLSQ